MTLHFGFLVFPGVQQLDLTAPYEVFASLPESQVHLMWKDCLPLTSATGLRLIPTTTLDDCPPLDVLCIPGGDGINPLLEDDQVLAFVRQRAIEVRYLTSVCTGSLVLAAAGLLRGKRATSHWNSRDFLARFGAIPSNDRIVRDGNLITAGGVTSGIDFALLVISELLGPEAAQVIQLALEYAPEPPFEAGTPEGANAAVLEEAKRRGQRSRLARETIIAKITAAEGAPPD